MKIAIIGGGAAGMMTAATLLEQGIPGSDIFIFEKNTTLGRKVMISGGGRCNVTTAITNKHQLAKKYVRGVEFLQPAFRLFPPDKVVGWFERHGVALKCEPDQRIFPVSDTGKDVVGAFEQLFSQHGVTICFAEPVTDCQPIANNQFHLKTKKAEYDFDIVVITSGGNAYRHTGSTGDGYAFASAIGHTITKLGPSLNSFEVIEQWPKDLSGISLPNVQLTATLVDGEKCSASGPFLFTHFGISGPATFALSAHLAFSTISPKSPLAINLQPIAGKDFNFWDKELHNLLTTHSRKQVDNVLAELLPRRFVEQVLKLAKIKHDISGHTITKEQRRALAHLLAGQMQIHLVGRLSGDEFVTAGGINLDEVDSQTLESKIKPGLYFGGEVLDVDGVTGGFNLQIAWATGRLAGMNIVKKYSSK